MTVLPARDDPDEERGRQEVLQLPAVNQEKGGTFAPHRRAGSCPERRCSATR